MKNILQDSLPSPSASLVAAVIWALVTKIGLEGSLVWGAIIGAIARAVRTNVERRHEHQRLMSDKKREQYYEFLDFFDPHLWIGGHGPAANLALEPVSDSR